VFIFRHANFTVGVISFNTYSTAVKNCCFFLS